EPRTTGVHRRKDARASHRKQRHGFGEPVDGVAPGLPQQQKDGGYERARMPDTDPPHEVDDGEAPADGDVDAPNANAFDKQVAERVQQHHRDQEAGSEADDPAERGRPRQDDGADLVGNRGERIPGLDDGRPLIRSFVRNFDFVPIVWHLLTCAPLTFPVQGWGCEFPPGRWCGVWYSGRPATRSYGQAPLASPPGCWDR